PPGSAGVASLLRGQVTKEVGAFSTPNAENSRNLFKLVDADPYPNWTWSQPGGRGVGHVPITASAAAQHLNQWLRLRHDIAHGHSSLTISEVLQHVRQEADMWLQTNPSKQMSQALDHLRQQRFAPPLRLVDAKACMALV